MCGGWDTPAGAFLEGLNAAASDFSRVWWMGFICRWDFWWLCGGWAFFADGISRGWWISPVWMCVGWDTPAAAFLEGLNAAASDFSRVADISANIWWMGFICRLDFWWLCGGWAFFAGAISRGWWISPVWDCDGWDAPAGAFLEGLNAAASDFSRVADMSVDIWWMGFICRWDF